MKKKELKFLEKKSNKTKNQFNRKKIDGPEAANLASTHTNTRTPTPTHAHTHPCTHTHARTLAPSQHTSPPKVALLPAQWNLQQQEQVPLMRGERPQS